MKKSNFISLVLGTLSGISFSLGLCMALLPEWHLLNYGITLGCIGLIMGLITVFIWRKMEHKKPININKRSIGAILLSVTGLLFLGIGMCFCLIWENIFIGTIIGIIGIFVLVSLIPICKGLK